MSGTPRDQAGAARDRDPDGRPRNARPRDELGRPLPRTAASDVPGLPDDLTVTPEQAAMLGGRLLAQDRPFHAHEVFEAAWKSAPGPDRELWRGLAQIAVGLTHARRGNARGATALLRRGAERMHGYRHCASSAGAVPEWVDAQFVAASARDLATRIEQAGLPAITLPDLRLRLRPG